jgi:hypothetical protein
VQNPVPVPHTRDYGRAWGYYLACPLAALLPFPLFSLQLAQLILSAAPITLDYLAEAERTELMLTWVRDFCSRLRLRHGPER